MVPPRERSALETYQAIVSSKAYNESFFCRLPHLWGCNMVPRVETKAIAQCSYLKVAVEEELWARDNPCRLLLHLGTHSPRERAAWTPRGASGGGASGVGIPSSPPTCCDRKDLAHGNRVPLARRQRTDAGHRILLHFRAAQAYTTAPSQEKTLCHRKLQS